MTAIKRVLVVHPYGIGDFLFLTPVLRALRLIPSIEKVDLVLGSRTSAVARENPHIDKIFVVDKGRYQSQSCWKTAHEAFQLGKELRSRQYDLLLDYSLRSEYAFWARMFLCIPKIAGFDYKRRGFLHNIKFPLPQGFSGLPVVSSYCDLAEHAGIPVEDRWMEFYIAESERQTAFEKWERKTSLAAPNYQRASSDAASASKSSSLGRFLFVSPGGGESWGKDAHFKQWPVSFFAQLCVRFVSAGTFKGVVILGSSGEKALAAQLAQKLTVPCYDFTGELSLIESAALLERAVLLLANDGGLVHIAHALRVPLLAFYGPVDPVVYGPWPPSPRALTVYKDDLFCRPCYKSFRYNSACLGRECLQELHPDTVWTRLEGTRFLNDILGMSPNIP